MCVSVRMTCVRKHACVYVCESACVRACVRACACVRVRVCVSIDCSGVSMRMQVYHSFVFTPRCACVSGVKHIKKR